LYYAIEAGVTDITILDPKFEFAYAELPKNVRVLSDIAEIEEALANMVIDMNDRVRNREKHFSLVIFDEFADAADQGGEALLKNFKMLLQKGRSAGFRFVAATQRASVKTIPGDIKVNLPVQVCFRVPKGLDSKVVLDTEGAECLNGAGDGLIHSPEYNDGLVRFQAFYRPL
jgi:DNA segregation ATPase FtsK/SpoIIIE-like protein